MRLVLVVISSICMGRCIGYLEDGVFRKYKNEARIRCGIDKFCVPAYLCSEEEINVNGEPALDPRIEFDVCGPTSQCCHLVNQKNKTRKFGFDLPYLGSFPPQSFGVGKSIRIDGLILPKLPKSYYSQLFVVRLQSGQNFWPKPSIAFELSDYTTAYGGHRKELSEYLPREKTFNLDIVRGPTSYKVYVNKQLVVEIPKQADEEIMDTLYMNGDFRLRDVVVENFSPTVAPKKPAYIFKGIGVVKEGVSFIVTGYTLPNWERFAINLRTAEDNIAFHIDLRQMFGVIAFNSFVDNSWSQTGHLDYKIPSNLKEGSKFTCQILVTEKCYMIAINGRHVYEFQHRLPYTSVSYVEAIGDIENVDLKLIEVSEYPERLPESNVEEIWVATG